VGALARLGPCAHGAPVRGRAPIAGGIYIDAGTRDEFFLDLGATAVRDALARVGVTDVQFELFDAGHMSIEYRYPIAMRYLAQRISATG
jgi:hypothetical protein